MSPLKYIIIIPIFYIDYPLLFFLNCSDISRYFICINKLHNIYVNIIENVDDIIYSIERCN